MPVEYIVSNINVSVFLNKYENGELSNVVSEKDINLAYLGQMGYDSISALAKLSGITLEYEPTKKSVQETTSEILIDYFSMDLSWSEQENLAELETAEKLQQLINILEKQPTYKISGMKETAINKLKEFQKNYVIE